LAEGAALSDENKTDPDVPPEVDESREARLQAEADAIDRAIAYRRPPVEYAQGATSAGEDGVRYYAEHAVSKSTEHATDPDGLVIVASTTNPGVAPPAQPPAEISPTRTAPMLIAPGTKNSTDPMWPPPSRGENATPPMGAELGHANAAVATPAAESASAQLGMAVPAQQRPRPKIDRSLEVTVDTYRPTLWDKHKRLIAIVGACCFAIIALLGILTASGEFAPKDQGASSTATSASPLVPYLSSVIPPDPVQSAAPSTPTAATSSVQVLPTQWPQPSAAGPASTQRSAPKPAVSAQPPSNQKPPSSKHGAMMDEEK
jgi:hypothetical protein